MSSSSNKEHMIILASIEENTEIEEEWLKRVYDYFDKRDDIQGRPMIPRVPLSILSNKECYEPRAVSIGPYHHGKTRLQNIQMLKWRMASIFMRKKNEANKVGWRFSDGREAYNEVKNMVLRERKEWYATDVDATGRKLGDVELAQLMFLDGCFVLQFMDSCIRNEFNLGDVEMSQRDINWVQRDLFLLENQLPFKVLAALEDHPYALCLKFALFIFHVTCVPIPKKFQQKAIQINGTAPAEKDFLFDPMFDRTLSGGPPIHFLHYLHKFRFNPEDFGEGQNPRKGSVDKYTYRSVKELKKVGIDFRPSPSWSYSEVRFKRKHFRVTAKLDLPGMHVNHLTKPMLLNLAAYEMAAPPGKKVPMMASSFICFMDHLIDDEEDVKELRSQGVLYNALGSDQMLADLFNAMGKDLVPDPTLYDARVNPRIDNYFYNRSWRIWFFQKVVTPYFRESPWSIQTYIAAILGLGLTMIQTYYSIHPSKNH